MKYVVFSIFLIFVSSYSLILGQNSETRAGSYPVRNYSSKENGGNAQIFDVVQDHRGMMYFANQKGVLEYDGVSWRTIEIGSAQKRVNCLTKDQHGNVIVGATGDFGILKADSSGRLIFDSWLISSGVDSIGSVNRIIVNHSEVILKSDHEILSLKNGKLSNRINTKHKINTVDYADGTYYAHVNSIGLCKFMNGKLRPLSGYDTLKNRTIRKVLSFSNKLLVITENKGIFEILDNKSLNLLSSLDDLQILSVGTNASSLFLGTYGKGLIILDQDLTVNQLISVDKGLIDATVKCLYTDREGILWLGTNIGVSKVAVNEPITIYGKEAGLTSGVEAIGRFMGKLYFATQNGVYVLNDHSITKVDGIAKDCYGIRSFTFGNDSILFIAGVNDVIAMNEEGQIKYLQKGGPYDFRKSPLDSNEVIVLHYDGLSKLSYEKGSFVQDKYLKMPEGALPFNFLIDRDGTIWIGTLNSDEYGIYKGHVNMFEKADPIFKRLGPDENLPRGASYLMRENDHLYVGTDIGLYELNNNSFYRIDSLGYDFNHKTSGVHRINKDNMGNIWMIIYDRDNNYEFGYTTQRNERYKWRSKLFNRHTDEIIHALYHEKNGITWLGGPGGVLRYDANKSIHYDLPYQTHFRMIKYGNDTLHFGGDHDEKLFINDLAYFSNLSLGFEFSSTSFIEEESTVYSYYMEGQDKSWSDWSNRTIKEYNLKEGTYTFNVKAKNIYGNISEVATVSIKILPPWYRSLWAYCSYIIIFMLLIYASIRLSIYRIRKKNLQLEKIVEKRTQEVIVQKEEAEYQRDQAEQQRNISEKQKTLIEEKNKEIIDSINYAKRIQNAIMPSIEAVKDALKEVFVLYLPKDVVAGDFFWMEKIGDVIYFAAADCTGHGVPGAMVSVVCSNALTKSLLEDKIETTGPLLDRTRDAVIEKLAKSGDQVKDGMDISLCALNMKTGELQWSGANNPLWIIRNGNNEIEEIKGDKQPIGLFERSQPFTTHDLQLKTGDMLIVFTDGYQDQFGGPRGKKFKPKQLKEVLINNKSIEMDQCKNNLEKVFYDWKGENEQVDDICMIGVQFKKSSSSFTFE